MDNIDIVKLSRLHQIVNNIDRDFGADPDADISFELLIGSCFPGCFNNVQEALTKQYIKGYNDGEAAAVEYYSSKEDEHFIS